MGGCEGVKDKKCPHTGDGEGDDMKGDCYVVLTFCPSWIVKDCHCLCRSEIQDG